MPWFITGIAAKERDIKSPHLLKVSAQRTFGFYNSYRDACQAIKENIGDMHECLYNYLILEYIEEGIFPHVHTIEWWEWKDKQWKRRVKPEGLWNTSNWALG